MNQLSVNIFDILILLGSIQGVFLALFLILGNRHQRKSNVFMAITLLGFALNSAFFALEGMGIRTGDLNTTVEYIPLLFYLLMIPSFHFFIEYLLNPKRAFTKKDYWWFVPYGFHLTVQLTTLCLFLFNKEFLFKNIRLWLNVNSWIDIAALVMCIYVLVTALIKLSRYQKNLLKNYAEISDKNFQWLRQLIILIFIVWILWSIPTLYEFIFNKPSVEIFYPMWIGLSVLIYWIGYATYAKQDVFGVQMFHADHSVKKQLSKKTDHYYKQLIDLIAQEKLYLDPDLNLLSLANKMDLSTGYMSQIINQHEQKNFFDFINGYRVESVKEKLLDPQFQHLSILGIAFESGFKSKSTFNLSFKKLAGQTPSAYKRAQKIALSNTD